MALMYEPVRSGFTFERQSCQVSFDWNQVASRIFNFKHVLGYGVIFLSAVTCFGREKIFYAIVLTFLFSALVELQQSFFSTGHCRLWDLVPNMIGIAFATMTYLAWRKFSKEK